MQLILRPINKGSDNHNDNITHATSSVVTYVWDSYLCQYRISIYDRTFMLLQVMLTFLHGSSNINEVFLIFKWIKNKWVKFVFSCHHLFAISLKGWLWCMCVFIVHLFFACADIKPNLVHNWQLQDWESLKSKRSRLVTKLAVNLRFCFSLYYYISLASLTNANASSCRIITAKIVGLIRITQKNKVI